MSAPFTPGPWVAHRLLDNDGTPYHLVKKFENGCPLARLQHVAEDAANARLIAAAPDHALIGWAMCVGAGRWEPFQSGGSGEFCMNGLRHCTTLDEFGVPEMTSGMRAAIAAAKGQA
jgi:hypothetical protein